MNIRWNDTNKWFEKDTSGGSDYTGPFVELAYSEITFTGAKSSGGTIYYLGIGTNQLEINVPSSKEISFRVNGSQVAKVGVTGRFSGLDFLMLTNNNFVQGFTTTPTQIRIIGVDASNKVSIDTDAFGATFGSTVGIGISTTFALLHVSKNINETAALSLTSTEVAKLSNPNNQNNNYTLLKFSGPNNDTSVLIGSRLVNTANGDSAFVIGVRSGGGALSEHVKVESTGRMYLLACPLNSFSTTVAGLPAGVQGDHAFVTDASGPVFGAAVVGGGAIKVPVYYTGAAWFVG